MKSHTALSAALTVGLLLGGMATTNPAFAASLPKGNCADPKPYTDLSQCRLRGADLRNRNLEGVNLRGAELYETQLQGSNLTNALIDGRGITYASLEGATGLPAEALAVLKTRYLATPASNAGFTLKALPQDYKGSPEHVAGLDNVDLAIKIPGSQSTIALLSYPIYGDSQLALILARFDNDKFGQPTCYQSVNPFNDGNAYYWGHFDSLKVRPLKHGGYLIGARASGNDGDGEGASSWFKIVLLELTPNCKLAVLHEEFLERAGDYVKRNGEYVTEWCGGELDYQFADDQTAEIKTTIPVSSKKICGDEANPREKHSTKLIKLRLHP
jgi:hypothetical protein